MTSQQTAPAPADVVTYVGAINQALDEALATDPTVMLWGEDIADGEGGGVFKTTAGLSAKYGDVRVRSTPISEQAIVGTAVGAALAGMRPVVEIMMMNFIAVAMDQIFNHAAKQRYMSGGQSSVPLTIRTVAGANGGFGAQHSDMLEAWFAHVPGLKVVIPSTPYDAKGLLLSCIFDDDPCIFMECASLLYGAPAGPVPAAGERVPLGKANIVRRGSDVSVITYGRPVHRAGAVAERLAGEGTDVEIVDLRTVSPWDVATVLESVARTRRAVVVHEAVGRFGVGAEIAAVVHEHLFGELAAPVRRVAGGFAPVPYARNLEDALLPGEADIEHAIRSVLG
jgi:pyruvate/2-oxoglutarate/acetoin dehydrogenase E1 component